MKSYLKYAAFALLGLFLVSGNAYAAVTRSGSDIYGDNYTVEDSSGNWTMAGNHTVQGNSTITGNQTVSGTIGGRKNVVLIDAATDTPNSVTLAKTGSVFVLTATKGAVGGVGYTLSLPSTNSTAAGSFTGENYTFATATGSTLSIRCASATDATIFFGAVNTTRVTSPASSGSSVTVVGSGRSWYVTDMYAPTNGGVVNWSTGTA